MSKRSARKRRVKRTVSIGKVAPEAVGQVEDLDGRIEAIQWLIPLGLKAVTEELQRAVVELAGPRYERKGSDQPLRRWGSQPEKMARPPPDRNPAGAGTTQGTEVLGRVSNLIPITTGTNIKGFLDFGSLLLPRDKP